MVINYGETVSHRRSINYCLLELLLEKQQLISLRSGYFFSKLYPFEITVILGRRGDLVISEGFTGDRILSVCLF